MIYEEKNMIHVTKLNEFFLVFTQPKENGLNKIKAAKLPTFITNINLFLCIFFNVWVTI